MPEYLSLIVKENVIVSAAEDGRVPWISADDIAAAAVQAFTAETIEQRDLYVVGPELLSYDDVSIFRIMAEEPRRLTALRLQHYFPTS